MISPIIASIITYTVVTFYVVLIVVLALVLMSCCMSDYAPGVYLSALALLGTCCGMTPVIRWLSEMTPD